MAKLHPIVPSIITTAALSLAGCGQTPVPDDRDLKLIDGGQEDSAADGDGSDGEESEAGNEASVWTPGSDEGDEGDSGNDSAGDGDEGEGDSNAEAGDSDDSSDTEDDPFPDEMLGNWTDDWDKDWSDENPTARGCGGRDNEDRPHGDHIIPLEGCLQVTPEIDQELPQSDMLNHSGPHSRACGYVNRVGAIALGDDRDELSLLYCDNDEEGGIRVAQVNLVEHNLESHIIVSGGCWPDVDTGVIVGDERGQTLYWTAVEDLDASEIRSDIWKAELSPEGTLELAEEPTIAIESVPDPIRFEIHGGRMVLFDQERTLYTTALNASGIEDGKAVAVAEDVTSYDAVTLDDGSQLLAICDVDYAMSLHHIDADGSSLKVTNIEEGDCSWRARPHLLKTPRGVLLSWADTYFGYLAFMNPEGAIESQSKLAQWVYAPAIAWDNGQERYFVIDSSGRLRAFDPMGEQLGQWAHPFVRTVDGTLETLELYIRDDRLVFAAYGVDYAVQGEHTIQWNWLELSQAALPETGQ